MRDSAVSHQHLITPPSFPLKVYQPRSYSWCTTSSTVYTAQNYLSLMVSLPHLEQFVQKSSWSQFYFLRKLIKEGLEGQMTALLLHLILKLQMKHVILLFNHIFQTPFSQYLCWPKQLAWCSEVDSHPWALGYRVERQKSTTQILFQEGTHCPHVRNVVIQQFLAVSSFIYSLTF